MLLKDKTNVRNKAAVIILLIIILAFNIYLELGTLHSTPFISDEGFALYISKSIFSGEIAYKNLFLNQPPLTYLFYGFLLQIFGWNLYIARFFAILIIAFNIILLFLLVKTITAKMPYSNHVALASSALYGIYPSYYGAGVNITGLAVEEPLLTTFCLLASIFYLKFLNSGKPKLSMLIVSGFFVGLAVMTKLTALFFLTGIIAFHLIYGFLSKKHSSPLAKEFSSFFIGLCVIPLTILLAICYTSSPTNFYIQQAANIHRQQIGQLFSPDILVYLKTILPILPITIIGIVFTLKKYLSRRVTLLFPAFIFTVNLLLFTTLLKSTSTKNLIILFPFNYFLAAFGFLLTAYIIWKIIKKTPKNWKQKAGIICLILILVAAFSFTLTSINQISNRVATPSNIYTDVTSFSPTQNENAYTVINYQVGKYVQSITSPNDEIWTSEGAIAFFAQRQITAPNSTVYPYQTFWADQLVFVKLSQFTQAWETEKTKVIVLILGDVKIGDYAIPYPDQCMFNDEALREYVESSYVEVKTYTFSNASYTIWERATVNTTNSSFEQGFTFPSNWKPLVWSGNASYAWSVSEHQNGARSVELSASTDSHSAWVSFPRVNLKTNETYEANVFLKTENVTGVAFLALAWFDKSGQWLYTSSSEKVSGTTNWNQVTLTAVPPSNASTVQFELHLEGSGNVWFDNFTFDAPPDD